MNRHIRHDGFPDVYWVTLIPIKNQQCGADAVRNPTKNVVNDSRDGFTMNPTLDTACIQYHSLITRNACFRVVSWKFISAKRLNANIRFPCLCIAPKNFRQLENLVQLSKVWVVSFFVKLMGKETFCASVSLRWGRKTVRRTGSNQLSVFSRSPNITGRRC